MESLIITFELVDVDDATFRQFAESSAPKFARVPGLVSMVWLANPEINTYGGAYLFETRAALEAYCASDFISGLATHPNLANVAIRDFGTVEEATAITAGPLATALAAA
jgi:hypothetical protein